MITLQHAGITTLSLAKRLRLNINQATEKQIKEFYSYLHKEIAWVLLPDAIRAFSGGRQTSHFEEVPGGNGLVSWMAFPSDDVLKGLTKENFFEKVGCNLQGFYPACVIGEKTRVDVFSQVNWDHPHYNSLMCHLEQDCVLDTILREYMVDVYDRFNDRFTIYHNGKIIGGAELRAQIALLEQLGFITLVGEVYKQTGILMDREWFEEHVFNPLTEVYPVGLVGNTIKYMAISDELNNRIHRHEFELTQEEQNSVFITNDLVGDLKKMYDEAMKISIMII